MTTSKGEAMDLFAQLSDVDALAVLEFAKMRFFCQMMKLKAKDIPSIDEWEKTPLVVRRLFVLAADNVSKFIYMTYSKKHIDKNLLDKRNLK
jgi:hypothetical protein